MCWLSGKINRWEITLIGGHKIYTEEHKWPVVLATINCPTIHFKFGSWYAVTHFEQIFLLIAI